MYERLLETEMHYNEHSIIMQYLCPSKFAKSDRGYSYLEQIKYGKKSNFLKSFYLGGKPGEF
jgi:hypothetical protein